MTRHQLHAIVALCAASAAGAQTQVPVRVLPPATVRSSEPITSIIDLMQSSGGRVIVNVPDQRRLISFDTTLTTVTILADTLGTKPVKYPRSFPPLIRLTTDSIFFPDADSRSFTVLDASGSVVRIAASVKANDFFSISQRRTGHISTFDAQGRLVYRGVNPPAPRLPSDGRGGRGGGTGAPQMPADTAPVVRADFATRTVDTLGYIKIPPPPFNMTSPMSAAGRQTATYYINPATPPIDEWVVTSEGHVAIVRGFDYHIDWILADGSRKSTPKMPFDWRRITEADKQARLDSAKRVVDSVRATGKDPYQITSYFDTRVDTIHPTIEYAALDKMADYFPPIRAGSTLADADGNIWILPTTSSQTADGLLYDVVNNSGVLFQRVRVPKDRIIVGFGRGGAVYMAALVAPSQWVLERTRVAR